MWLLLILLLQPASAEVPLPSYRDELTTGAWVEVNQQIEEGRLDDAIKNASRFEKHVIEDAGIAYLTGLAYRMKGDPISAEKHLRRSVALDPTRKDAWSDLGELLLADARYLEAEAAFHKVDELLPTGRYAWIGPFRLAEVAAHQSQTEVFEGHMREALRRGFTFRTIENDVNWRKFYANPEMRDSVEKLITVYGDRRILDTLQPAPQPKQGAG